MTDQIKKRLRSRAGESISEVLIAVLISAIGLALLAGMISAANNLITRSKTATAAYVSEENILSEQPDSIPSGSYVEKKDGSVSISDAETSAAKKLVDDVNAPIPVVTYSVSSGNKTIVSYKVKNNAS